MTKNPMRESVRRLREIRRRRTGPKLRAYQRELQRNLAKLLSKKAGGGMLIGLPSALILRPILPALQQAEIAVDDQSL